MPVYRLEMNVGQDIREIIADSFSLQDEWMVFYRKPVEGGINKEYWRARICFVVSMETKR